MLSLNVSLLVVSTTLGLAFYFSAKEVIHDADQDKCKSS